MKKTRFTEEQITFALRQADIGTAVEEITRKMGVSEATFFCWWKKYAGLGVAELWRLKQLEEENRQLKHLVAYLSLDSGCWRMCYPKSAKVGAQTVTGKATGTDVATEGDFVFCRFCILAHPNTWGLSPATV